MFVEPSDYYSSLKCLMVRCASLGGDVMIVNNPEPYIFYILFIP